MATYTPNLNLYMPDSTDDFGDFRAEHNDNMVKLDNAIGGGGGGHTIVDPSGTDMPAESKLQFTGGVTVTDDNVNGKTVVDISGGGGNVYGAFIDTNRVIASGNIPQGSSTYTATEDCALLFTILSDSNNSAKIEIDGVKVWEQYDQNGINSFANFLLVRSGQTVTFTQSYSSNGNYKAYGLTQGTNGIFTPIIYSDNERVVGVWRDNKPLYQKTVSIGSLPNNATKITAHGISDIDTICLIDGIAYDGSGKTLPLGYVNVDSYTYDVQVEVGKVNVEIKTKIDFSSYTGYVTLRYTKTTDVAGSGNWNTDGVPTVHYSTSEQVIGTYLGKPLYQRTWNNLTVAITANSWANTGISAIDIDVIVDGTMQDDNKQKIGGTIGFMSSHTYIGVYPQIGNRDLTSLTVQYTKSTD